MSFFDNFEANTKAGGHLVKNFSKVEWKIEDPELEKLYVCGQCKKKPIINSAVAKKFAIRVQQIEAAKCIEDLRNLQSLKFKKSKGHNFYSINIEGDSYFLIELKKNESDSSEIVNIIELYQ